MPCRLAMIAFAVAAYALGFASCAPSAEPAAPAREKPLVFVSNPFLADMARELAGDAVELHQPWRASGGDPAYWRPSADEIRVIQSCDLVVLNGAGFEKWAEQAALPRRRTVDTTESVRAQLIEEAGETHSHGPEGEHAHGGTAFTTWLSPEIGRVQMAAVAERLAGVAPARSAEIAGRAKELHE
ncbi:MAG: metal ABC transporter substrate-binding protein, partial [Planctomycetota bacterium]